MGDTNRCFPVVRGTQKSKVRDIFNRTKKSANDKLAVCKALGVQHVYEVNGYKKEEIEQRLLAELDRPEPSVIVVNQKCVMVKKTRS